MSKIISLVSLKGGTGKTAVALNLGGALVRRKRKVLLVDLDSQGALSFAVMGNLSKAVKTSVYDLLLGEGVDVEETAEGYDLIPANLELEQLVAKRIDGKGVLLKDALTKAKGYDYILIDTPPALNIFTAMAVMASRSAYVVVNADLLSYRALLAVDDFIRELKPGTRRGVIVNMFDQRRNIEKELLRIIKEGFPKALFKSTVRRSVIVPEAVALTKDILSYRKSSPVAKDIEALAREVIRREEK